MTNMQLRIGRLVTGLMVIVIVMSAVPDVLRVSDAIGVFRHLGYPSYLLPFLGTGKLLGIAVVLAPGVARLKEWAFAGLAFDVTGALHSHLSVGDPPSAGLPAAVGVVLVLGSYLAFRARSTQVAPELGRASRRV